MLDRFFTAHKTKWTLAFLLLLSAGVAAYSFFTPISRKNYAVQQRGSLTITETKALALTLDYYDAPEMLALSRMPAETAFYKSLCGLLARAKETFEYNKVYLLYRGVGGRLGYLADSDYRSNTKPGIDYQPVGAAYGEPRYPVGCTTSAESVFSGKSSFSYSPMSLHGDWQGTRDFVVSYLPLKALSGQVIAVLGVDAALIVQDYGRFGPFNLQSIGLGSLAVFGASFLLMLVCLDRTKKHGKNDDKKSRKKTLKKENGILVDNLDDVDPEEYL